MTHSFLCDNRPPGFFTKARLFYSACLPDGIRKTPDGIIGK